MRLDRQHVGVDGGLRRQGRAQAARAGPRGQDRGRQDGPGDHPRRPGDHGPRQLRRLPATGARRWPEHYPVALVNSVNPVRLQGQKTASFEIVDCLGDAPDHHLLPVGNAGNISAYWLGYTAVRRPRPRHRSPVMRGFQAEGAAPLVTGEPFPRPRDQGDRDPDRQPGVVEAGRGGARRVRRPFRRGHRRPDPRRPARAGPPRRRLRRAGLGRRRRRAAAGSRAGRPTPAHRRDHRDRSRAQGRRHRPRGRRADLVDQVVDADVDAAAAAAGLEE